MNGKTHNGIKVSENVPVGTSILHDVRFWNLLLIAATAALFIGYLAMTTAEASRGFTLRTLQKKVGALNDQSRRAEIKLDGSRSMKSIDAAVRGLGFVPIDTVQYLGPGTTAVARR